MDPKLKKEMTEEAQQKQGWSEDPVLPEEPAATPPDPVPEVPAEPVPPAQDPVVPAQLEKKLCNIQQDLDELMGLVEKLDEPRFDYYRIEKRVNEAQLALEKKLSVNAAAADDTAELKAMMQQLLDQQNRNDQQLRQSLRETGNFQVQVRQRMQREMDEMREQQTGAQYNGLLREIAAMYADYQSVLKDESMSPQTRRLLQALFAQMEDVLGDYDAEVCVSEVGQVRPKNQCKIINKEMTGDPTRHNTIIRSLKPGVKRDRLILQHEYVDVYVYDEALDPVLHPELNPAAEPTAEPVPEPVEPVAEPMPEPLPEPQPEEPVTGPAPDAAGEAEAAAPATETAPEQAPDEAPAADAAPTDAWNTPAEEIHEEFLPQQTAAPTDKKRKIWPFT